MLTAARKIAVVGGGWAGCAAAVELARRGHSVTLLEAARTLGGRARRVEVDGRQLDNGQHILLGAYGESLRLMRLAGIDTGASLLRLPLQIRYPDGAGMDFAAARLPAPWHMVAGLLRARGLARADKLALARFSTTARWMGWRLDTDCTVTELLERYDQTARLIRLMWRPLCIAALNTVPERASAQVFLNVLRDSLGAGRAASDMLIPLTDLSTLFPEQAARYVRSRGGTVRCGAAVTRLSRDDDARWRLEIAGQAASEACDGVVLAVHPGQVARLAGDFWKNGPLPVLEHEPITTCYLQYAPSLRLERPMFALLEDPARQAFGQFVFDRGHLVPGEAGLLAVVVSTAGAALAAGHEALGRSLAAQLAQAFGAAALGQPQWTRLISEKRATFSCTPALRRPPNASGVPGLAIAGDYTEGEYPATLEGAVRSGVAAAQLVGTG